MSNVCFCPNWSYRAHMPELGEKRREQADERQREKKRKPRGWEGWGWVLADPSLPWEWALLLSQFWLSLQHARYEEHLEWGAKWGAKYNIYGELYNREPLRWLWTVVTASQLIFCTRSLPFALLVRTALKRSSRHHNHPCPVTPLHEGLSGFPVASSNIDCIVFVLFRVKKINVLRKKNSSMIK